MSCPQTSAWSLSTWTALCWTNTDRYRAHSGRFCGVSTNSASSSPLPADVSIRALTELFAPAADLEAALIAENGSLVVRDGCEISAITVARTFTEHAVGLARRLAATHDIGLVWSGRSTAYVERDDPDFLAEAGRFYLRLEVVDDLLEIGEAPLKFAVYDPAGAARSHDGLATAFSPYQVVMSGTHWMDVLDPQVNKGVALRALQRALGVRPEQTVVFGDYLNDLEMLAVATHSFAMANAHPRVLRAARYRAPSNRDHGVVSVLGQLVRAVAARRGVDAGPLPDPAW